MCECKWCKGFIYFFSYLVYSCYLTSPTIKVFSFCIQISLCFCNFIKILSLVSFQTCNRNCETVCLNENNSIEYQPRLRISFIKYPKLKFPKFVYHIYYNMFYYIILAFLMLPQIVSCNLTVYGKVVYCFCVHVFYINSIIIILILITNHKQFSFPLLYIIYSQAKMNLWYFIP